MCHGGRPLGDGWMDVELRYGLRRDDDAYSPLLGGGAALRAHLFNARAEYRKNLTPAMQMLASLEIGAQYANLPLFDLHSTAFHLGLRWQW